MRLSVTALVPRILGGHCPSEVNIRALMRPKFNLRLERGTGSPVFSGRRNAVCDACLPKREDFLSPPPLFLCQQYLCYTPHTRSTLRDNRVQRERWGNYTILVLKVANSGLSAPVSTANTCHSYYCKEKKAHSLYYL